MYAEPNGRLRFASKDRDGCVVLRMGAYLGWDKDLGCD
jgi:hypothetical protein